MKWERVESGVDLWRVEVPGGWLYMGPGPVGHSPMSFVPRPPRTEDVLERLLVATRAAQALLGWVEEHAQADGGGTCIVCRCYQIRRSGTNDPWPHIPGCVYEDARVKIAEALS